MAENNKVQLKREEVVGDEVVLSDINPKTSTDAVEDYQGMSLSEILDRIYNTINNKLSRNVNSVNGRTGVVVLTSEDVGLGNVSNVSYADIKRWVIEQIKQAFKDHTMKMFDYLEQVIDFAENHDETYDGTPFFSEMGYKYRNGYEDKRACIGYFYYENNSLQAAWKMLNTIGETDNSIIYNEKLEYNNPSLYEDKDYRGGKLGVNIHKDETALKIMNEASTNKASSGLYIDKDAIVPYVHFFDGVYGKAADWNTPPDDPDALLYYDQSSIPSDAKRVDIYIDGVEVGSFASSDEGTEHEGDFYLTYLRHPLKLNDIVITNFNDDLYYDRTTGKLYPGMLDSLTCRQFAIGKVTQTPTKENVNLHYKIELFQIKLNAFRGLKCFPTNDYHKYEDTLYPYKPEGSIVGLNQIATEHLGRKYSVDPGFDSTVFNSSVYYKPMPDKDGDFKLNISGLSTDATTNRDRRQDGSAAQSNVITPLGQSNNSSSADGVRIETDYSLCVMPRFVFNNYELITEKPSDWDDLNCSYWRYYHKETFSAAGASPVWHYTYVQLSKPPCEENREYVQGEYFKVGSKGDSNAYICRNLPMMGTEYDKNIFKGDDISNNDSAIGVNLEKVIDYTREPGVWTPPFPAINKSGLRILNEDSLKNEWIGESIYEPLTEKPSDWDDHWIKYYERNDFGFFKHLSGDSAPTFYPPGEFSRFARYYKLSIYSPYTKGKHSGGLAVNVGDFLDIGSSDTGYIRLTSEPDDWSTNWRNYYVRIVDDWRPGEYIERMSDYHECPVFEGGDFFTKASEYKGKYGSDYFDNGKVNVRIDEDGGLCNNGDNKIRVALLSDSLQTNGFKLLESEPDNFNPSDYFKIVDDKYVPGVRTDVWATDTWYMHYNNRYPTNSAYAWRLGNIRNKPAGYANGMSGGLYVELGLGLANSYINPTFSADVYQNETNYLSDLPCFIRVNIADPGYGRTDMDDCIDPLGDAYSYMGKEKSRLYCGLRYLNYAGETAIGVRVNDNIATQGIDIKQGTRGLCIDEKTNVLGIQISGWSEDGLSFDSNGKLIMTGFIRVDADLATLKAHWNECYILKVAATTSNQYSITSSDFKRLWNSQSEAESAQGVTDTVYKRVFDASHSF